MAKKSKVAKLAKQRALVAKYADLRAELKAKGDYLALSQLPTASFLVGIEYDLTGGLEFSVSGLRRCDRHGQRVV